MLSREGRLQWSREDPQAPTNYYKIQKLMILNNDLIGPRLQPHAWDMGRPLLSTAMSCWSSQTSWRLSWAQILKWTPKSWSSCLWRRGTFSRCNMETLSAKCRRSRRSWTFSSKSVSPRRRERCREILGQWDLLKRVNLVFVFFLTWTCDRTC